nr:MAPEG family protein [Gloeotrichia echinulata DEX184]
MHAWGQSKIQNPKSKIDSPGRAMGFFLTWFVYVLGAGACIYYGITGLFPHVP